MIGIRRLSIEERRRSLLRVGLGLWLLLPYLIWLLRISEWSWPAASEWMPQFATALLQSLLSAGLAIGVGFVLFLAAQAWTGARGRAASELALLLPNMMPPLFLILSLLAWVTPWRAFPYGLGAVIVAHVLLNSGLVAVSLDRLVQRRLGAMAEAAWLLGASRWKFWREVAWPFLRADLACVFLFVFSLCFTSFSIPLILGGDRAATLEVAIFDFVRLEGRWDKAVILAALQSVMLLALAFSLPHSFFPSRPARRPLGFLAWRSGRFLVFIPTAILLLGWGLGVAHARSPGAESWPWLEATLNSAALGLAVGLLHLILFLLTAYVTPHAPLTRFLNGYLAPSSAITGFALLLVPGAGEAESFVKLVVALSLISFPLLYRWIVHAALAPLANQIQVARTLGARGGAILFEIVWPQAAPAILRACGLAALWASGDFAISGIVAGSLRTLPLLMENLIGSYRIESAELLMFPLLFLGLALYGLFNGVTRYVRH